MIEEKKRWLAFYLLCTGELMIVLDTTVVRDPAPAPNQGVEYAR